MVLMKLYVDKEPVTITKIDKKRLDDTHPLGAGDNFLTRTQISSTFG
ncbi:hypothetical protein [Alteribacillus persepolensis]|nr:hypothetical protein [Alteribacillus persepolensis]